MVSLKKVATIFDHHGFVTVLQVRIGNSDPTYRIRAGVWSRDKGTCLRLKRQFGGHAGLAFFTNDSKKRKYYRLQLTSALAVKFLKGIVRYLKRKGPIVRAALRLADTVQAVGHRYTPASLKRRRRLYLRYLVVRKDYNSKVRIWRWKDKKVGYGG